MPIIFDSSGKGVAGWAAGSSNYIGLLIGFAGSSSTEVQRQVLVRNSYVVSNARVYILTNDRGTSTFVSRKNTANGNLSISITASGTGWFEDTTNSDSIVSGDYYCGLITVGSGGSGFAFTKSAVDVHTDSGYQGIIFGLTGQNFTAALTTYYWGVHGTGAYTTEAYALWRMRIGGTFSKLGAYISANTRSSGISDTLGLEVNSGTVGNLIISIVGGTTGYVEDTSNSDTVTSSNSVAFYLSLGNDTNGINFQIVKLEFVSSSLTAIDYFHIYAPGASFVYGITYYGQLFYTPGTNLTVEAQSQVKVKHRVKYKNLQMYLGVNNTTSGSTVQNLRINGADGNQSVSYAAGITGWAEDTSNEDILNVDDLVNTKFIVGGSGTEGVLETSHGGAFERLSIPKNSHYYAQEARA